MNYGLVDSTNYRENDEFILERVGAGRAIGVRVRVRVRVRRGIATVNRKFNDQGTSCAAPSIKGETARQRDEVLVLNQMVVPSLGFLGRGTFEAGTKARVVSGLEKLFL